MEPNVRSATAAGLRRAEQAGFTSAPRGGSAARRLFRKVYEADPLGCPRCGSPLRRLAAVTEPAADLCENG